MPYSTTSSALYPPTTPLVPRETGRLAKLTLVKLSRNYLQLPIAALVDEYAKSFERDTAPSASWKGGRFAHQRPHSIMDNADNVGVGYLNNAPIPHLAFVLPSVGCSVSVAGSDTGPKILGIIVGR
jgi:hypothetical protein